MLKWRHECTGCGSISDLGKANTTVFHYVRQQMFDHLETVCLICLRKTCIWKLDTQDIDIAALEGFLAQSDFAPDEVIRRHNDFLGISDSLKHLTPRQERRIAFETYYLDREWEVEDAG